MGVVPKGFTELVGFLLLDTNVCSQFHPQSILNPPCTSDYVYISYEPLLLICSCIHVLAPHS